MLYEITKYIRLLDVDSKDIFLACIFITDFIFQHNITFKMRLKRHFLECILFIFFQIQYFLSSIFFITVFYHTKQGRNEIKYSNTY